MYLLAPETTIFVGHIHEFTSPQNGFWKNQRKLIPMKINESTVCHSDTVYWLQGQAVLWYPFDIKC